MSSVALPVEPPPPPDPGRVPAVPDRGPRRRTPRPTVARGPASVTINHGSTFMVCSGDGGIIASEATEHGLYADDTRFLSHHRMRLNGRPLRLIAASLLSFRHSRWTYHAPEISSPEGPISDVRVVVSLDRLMSARRLHEDITVAVYGAESVGLLLALELKTDFADIFEVRTKRWQRRSSLTTTWHDGRLETTYRRDSFIRRCLVRVSGTRRSETYANGELHFPIDVAPGRPWRVCLQYDLVTRPRARPSMAPCPLARPVDDRAERLRRRWRNTVARVTAADPRLQRGFEQAVEDFAALRLFDHDFSPDVWLPAAGLPWFVAPFGRDSIIASLQAMPVHPLFAIGTLQVLAAMQSTVDDPERDAEPGKICHEMRVGEWAHFHTIPHSPYYGTADATPLYLMLLAETHRWLGNPDLLAPFRGAAERCLEWIDRYGDRDGDGLQEYAPRAPRGYRNQCWRDAEDGVLDEFGDNLRHPIGTCEMQAYVVAAKQSVAPLFEAWGDAARGRRLRVEAAAMRDRMMNAYWVDEDGTLAFALDGRKRVIRTATSNPGHCLWTGVVDAERGQRVAERLMRPDLWSGFGLRTLSSEHPAFDPFSYQRGSVWPHDSMLAAAGMRRYGRVADSWAIVDGLLDAVTSFERCQMPELFAGLQRREDDVPLPYEQANVPQAWAAGSMFQAVRLLLGFEPDVPAGRVYVDPALPPWCPELTLDNVRVGGERLSIHARRQADGTTTAGVTARSGHLEVVQGPPPWLVI